MPSFAAYDGTRLGYTTMGDGRPLVCLPGGPGRAVGYLEDLAGLSEVRQLILLDPRATGRSDVPADPGSLRFDRLAEDVEALREHLGLDTVDVAAHSAGTLVTQAWAAVHPDRVGRLVLVTPSAALQGHDRTAELADIRARRAGEVWYTDAAEAQEALTDALPAQRGALTRAIRPFWYGRWDERCQAHAASADSQTNKRAELGFAAGYEHIDVPSLVAGLARVDAPVLVVGGELDAMTGVGSVAAVATCFPKATTAVVPGAGHFPWVDEPAAFRAVVEPFVTL